MLARDLKAGNMENQHVQLVGLFPKKKEKKMHGMKSWIYVTSNVIEFDESFKLPATWDCRKTSRNIIATATDTFPLIKCKALVVTRARVDRECEHVNRKTICLPIICLSNYMMWLEKFITIDPRLSWHQGLINLDAHNSILPRQGELSYIKLSMINNVSVDARIAMNEM